MINKNYVKAIPAATLVAALSVLVAQHEGDGPTSVTPNGEKVHHAYPDPAHGWKVPTICQGRTKGVFPGMTVSAKQCELWLHEELNHGVVKALERNVKVPITLDQAVALGLFLDNVGETQFKSSALLRKLNAGDCYGAAREFNSMPQIDPTTKQVRRWSGKTMIHRETGKVLLRTGDPIMKWTTAGGVPLPGLILRRTAERAKFEPGCKE